MASMNRTLRQAFAHLRLRRRTGLAAAAQWLAVWFFLLWLLRLVPGWPGTFFGILQWMVALALAGLAIPLLVRLVQQHMLWSLRNKLILTYLLIGLAPFILLITLVLISAYIAAGQFSIHLAATRLQAELNQMDVDNSHLTDFTALRLTTHAPLPQLPIDSNTPDRIANANIPRFRSLRRNTEFLDGTPIPQSTFSSNTPLGLPPWALHLHNDQFQGLVLDAADLYLVAIHQRRLPDGRLLTLMTSLPIDTTVMTAIAEDLGHATLYAQPTGKTGIDAPPQENLASTPSSTPDKAPQRLRKLDLASHVVSGGTVPAPIDLADIDVRFTSTIPIVDWDTGDPDNILITVDSRPSVLYRALFGSSLGGIISSVIRLGLIGICILFALIEILALRMAVGLSRTITASVSDLYQATLKIDHGEFQHRITVTRNDQLAELSRSFNRMTGSLERLLVEQQEKERLQNELSIAQEVQANLFPTQQADLASLQLHGICRPARSVSGDYYDFLVFHENRPTHQNGSLEASPYSDPLYESPHNGAAPRRETGVGIALGDISGKGISAALLMATLHSAVRAYRFASEELIFSESTLAGLTASRDDLGNDSGELFQSPGRILSLLNRHLYRSTQPEKYATLFLAHYDVVSSRLTYSNAGQLPPLVLCADNTILRLDKGGTVVGLMDGMKYEEASFRMKTGDIVVAYSDGVTEPENDFGDFGEERLMEVVRRYRHEPLHVISSQVMQALDAWIGAAEQPDDITLVLARQL